MSFARRALQLTFTLGKGSFGADGSDTVTVSGLRTTATIKKTGGAMLSELTLEVGGLDPSTANKLSTLGKPLKDGRDNSVTVSAADADGAMSVAFTGTISEAWVDFDQAPDIAFTALAQTGLINRLKPVPPSSFGGSADVATMLAALADQAGMGFENSGVSVRLSNPYFSGTTDVQVKAIAEAANINAIVDDGDGPPRLCIWPMDGSRKGVQPLVSPDTGLVGYPKHTENGIMLKMYFNPQITYGALIQVQSSVQQACGVWTVFNMTHELSCETPDGPWFTTLECAHVGGELPVGK